MMRFTPPDNGMVGPFAQCVRHPTTPLTYHGTNSWIFAARTTAAVVDPSRRRHASGIEFALGAASPWPPWR
ncbi:MAG: hypothetical protein ACLSDQ_12875 [Adlercreutzia equolifaciens]